MFFTDLFKSFSEPGRWLFTTWFKFLIRYRRTAIGPLWIIASPILFIFFLGALMVGLSNVSTSIFIPHMTIGLVCWTLLGGFINRSHSLFNRNVAYLVQGHTRHTDIVLIDNAELIVHFMHQAILILAVCLFYKTTTSPYAFMCIPGFLIVILNGYWISMVFGILGARYKDLGEIVGSIVSIAFLATPIIWMPVRDGAALGGRGTILQAYMTYNPFYHFLEIIRAPLMNIPIEPLTWYVVGGFTIFGYSLVVFVYWRYRHMVVIWV